MGMYDTVVTKCKTCQRGLEFQSKAGECNLLRYELHDVPVGIANDLEGEEQECPRCGEVTKIMSIAIPPTVRMVRCYE